MGQDRWHAAVTSFASPGAGGAASRRLLRYLRGRPLLTLGVGAALEVAAMSLLTPALVPFPWGTPGAAGVAIAVLAALAAGPAVGAIVAVVGWLAFFFIVVGMTPLALLALPLWSVTAYVAGVLANALAQTERELAARENERDELRRVDRLKTNFIALASHELRTPAAAIYGITETLEERGDVLPPEQLHALRSALREQSGRLRQLVDQLLDLSRLEAHAVELRPEPFPVRTHLEQLVPLLAGERAGDVRIDVPPDLEVVADPPAFDRIVSNLVTNAFRYGEAPITIAAEQRDRHFRLTVEDRGAGVPREFAAQLFEPFARSRTVRDRNGGTGLGLAIAQSYAHAHGGDLFYEEAEPHGARFQLVLPRLRLRR